MDTTAYMTHMIERIETAQLFAVAASQELRDFDISSATPREIREMYNMANAVL
jgi:hypothetical protein